MQFENLIECLKSDDSEVRNNSALELMALGDKRAIKPLVSAILNPKNLGQVGTIVYSLNVFEYHEYLEKLFDLLIKGNYEVCSGILDLFDESLYTDYEINNYKNRIELINIDELESEHNIKAIKYLAEFFS